MGWTSSKECDSESIDEMNGFGVKSVVQLCDKSTSGIVSSHS